MRTWLLEQGENLPEHLAGTRRLTARMSDERSIELNQEWRFAGERGFEISSTSTKRYISLRGWLFEVLVGLLEDEI